MLMILDNFSNTSKVLEQKNVDELYTGIYINFELQSPIFFYFLKLVSY